MALGMLILGTGTKERSSRREPRSEGKDWKILQNHSRHGRR